MDAGEGAETLCVVLKGCPCVVEDLQMLVVVFLREKVRERKAASLAVAKKPCGCKEKKMG